MIRLLALIPVSALASCSLLFTSTDDQSVDIDAAGPAVDAGSTPLRCARVTLFEDSFDVPGEEGWNLAIRGDSTATETGGQLVMSLTDSGDEGAYVSSESFDLDYVEVIADISTSTSGGTFGLVKMVASDGLGGERSVEAGRLPEGFGWQAVTGDGAESGNADMGRTGPWRLRRSGPDLLIENLDPDTTIFREDGRVSLPDAVGTFTANLEARREAAGADLVNFASVEISGPPADGWCQAALFDFVPNQGDLGLLFETHVVAGGEVLESAGGVLSVSAPNSGSQALVRSTSRYNMNDGAFIIRLDKAAAMPAGNAVVEFQHSSQNRFGFWVTGPQLRSYTVIADELAFVTSIYDPNRQKFLRVSMATPGELTFETSEDGANWGPLEPTLPDPMVVPFPADDLEIILRATGVDPTLPQEVRLDISRISGQGL